MPASKKAHAEAEALVEAIKPYFLGAAPHAVGLALAEMVAMYIAGHRPTSGDKAKRDEYQADLLAAWFKTTALLVPVKNRWIDLMLAKGAYAPIRVLDEPPPQGKPH